MSKNLIFLILLFIGFELNAQIENEIKSFNDSSDIIINNGRKMIVQSIVGNDNQKSIDIYKYLQKTSEGKGYSAFYYSEEINLNLLISNWSEWILKAKQYNFYSGAYCHPNVYPISRILYDELRKKNNTIIELLQASSLNDEDKRVIKIYLYLIEDGMSEDIYTKMLKDFNKDYPNSSYNDFLKFHLPNKSTKGSFGFSLGSRVLFLTENLNNNFKPDPLFSISLNINVNRFFSSLYFTGGSFYLKSPFTAYNGKDTLDLKNRERFSYFQGGAYLGYFILRNNKFHISPYINLSGGYLESTKFNSNNNNDEDGDIKIYSSFIYGAGLHTEIKIWELKHKNHNLNFAYYGLDNHISFKIETGFDMIPSTNFSNKYKGNIGYLNIGLTWGLGDF